MQFSIKATDRSVRTELNQQRKDGHFCDLILHVDSRSFPVHRNVVSVSSLFFRSILKSDCVQREELRILHFAAELMDQLLDFMYTGSVVLHEKNTRQLLLTSDFFLVPSLRTCCEDYLISSLRLENCLSSREVASFYGLTRLSAAVYRFIRCHIAEVLDLNLFLDMNFQFVENFLTDYRTGCGSVPCQDLVNVVVAWVKRNIPHRSHRFAALLQCVRRSEWKLSEIEVHLKCESLYNESPFCFFVLLKQMFDTNMDLGAFASDFKALSAVFNEHCDSDILLPDEDTAGTDFLLPEKRTAASIEVVAEDSPVSHVMSVDSNESNDRSNSAPIDGCETMSWNKCLPKESEDQVNTHSDESENSCSEQESISSSHNNANSALITCPHCEFTSYSATQAERHLAIVHEEDQTYRCKVCNFDCKWNSDYYKHMKTHFPGPAFHCPDCDYIDGDIKHLLRHRLMHAGDQILSCTLCDYGSRLESDLKLHIQMHVSQKKHRCTHCGRCFEMEQSLHHHLLTHLPVDPVTASCHYPHQVPKHESRNPRLKQANPRRQMLRCQQENCSYWTRRRSQLAAHNRSHQSLRSHVCGVCRRAFVEKSHLIRHERIHLLEKPFKCEVCDYSSTRRDKLKEHRVKHHPTRSGSEQKAELRADLTLANCVKSQTH